MNLEVDKTKPMNGWLLCRALQPEEKSGDLWIPTVVQDKVISEGVAEILAAGPGPLHEDSGVRLPMGIEVGDKVLYRGFLRFAQQVGDHYGEKVGANVFLLNVSDVLATVEGPGTIGLYGEYVLEG